MTRWVRRKNKEEHEASSWNDLKKGAASAGKDERLEKRRAARRERRKKAALCFHCRQPGHQVADCPNKTGSGGKGDIGICFKCGSTEHKIQDCTAKVGKDEMPFATCFICKEKGHLSSKCPDNPKGLYPEGGGCRFCGSVLHYRRDCPERAVNQNKDAAGKNKRYKMMEENENVEAIADSDEDEGEESLPLPKKAKRPKVVKF